MPLTQKTIIRLCLGLSLTLSNLALFHASLSPVRAMGGSNPPVHTPANLISNKPSGELINVSVEDTLTFPIVQQPANNAGYVSPNANEITQFRLAAQYGNVGLLAHNYLAGKSFSQFKVGQKVRLTYNNGRVEHFIISEVLEFQALQPNNVYSSFKHINTAETLTAEQLFNDVYRGDRHVTFQTCIEANGNVSWGRLFIIALPMNQDPPNPSAPYPS